MDLHIELLVSMINSVPPEQFMDIHELLWTSIILIMEIHDYEFGFP